nr:MAG TPA: hypothetical protein [Caudoviricetes sp.]
MRISRTEACEDIALTSQLPYSRGRPRYGQPSR